MKRSERFFWIGMRSLSLLLAIGIFIIIIMTMTDRGSTVFAPIGIAVAICVGVSHLSTLPSPNFTNPHAPSPSVRFYFDTIAILAFAYNGAVLSWVSVSYVRSMDDTSFPSSWSSTAVAGVALNFGIALVHFVMAIYDVIEMRCGGVEWPLEGDVENEADNEKAMSGGLSH